MAIPAEWCEATGKIRWPNEREARDELSRSRQHRLGQATKGKTRERRVTSCEACGGFHLTSWSRRRYHHGDVW